MLVLLHLSELLLVVGLELRIMSFYRVGSFNKVIAEKPVARSNSLGVFGFKLAGLVLAPMSGLHTWPERLGRQIE